MKLALNQEAVIILEETSKKLKDTEKEIEASTKDFIVETRRYKGSIGVHEEAFSTIFKNMTEIIDEYKEPLDELSKEMKKTAKAIDYYLKINPSIESGGASKRFVTTATVKKINKYNKESRKKNRKKMIKKFDNWFQIVSPIVFSFSTGHINQNEIIDKRNFENNFSYVVESSTMNENFEIITIKGETYVSINGNYISKDLIDDYFERNDASSSLPEFLKISKEDTTIYYTNPDSQGKYPEFYVTKDRKKYLKINKK